MSSYTNTFIILGKTASIDINDRGDYMCVDLDGMVITDACGDIGFWYCFNKTRGSFAKGAARQAALDKFAREWVESEIVEYIRFAQR